MKTFVVGYIDWSDHELTLERIEAPTWQQAVMNHTKFPWRKKDGQVAEPYRPTEEEAFKQACFDCDCMMSWIEV